MSAYFNSFPTIQYVPFNGAKPVLLKDITRRVKLLDSIKDHPFAFLPYTIKDDMTPSQLAHLYYGSPSYEWIIHLANNSFDPYYQWPISLAILDKVIEQKYKSMARDWWHNANPNTRGARPDGKGIVHWTQRINLKATISHYKLIDGDDTVSVDTFNVLSNPLTSYIDPTFKPTDYRAVRFYEYETDMNEKRRHIQMVNKSLIHQLSNDLKRLINND